MFAAKHIVNFHFLFSFTTVIQSLCQKTTTWTIKIAKHFTSKWPVIKGENAFYDPYVIPEHISNVRSLKNKAQAHEGRGQAGICLPVCKGRWVGFSGLRLCTCDSTEGRDGRSSRAPYVRPPPSSASPQTCALLCPTHRSLQGPTGSGLH